MKKYSPMIMQYLEIKENYKDYIVFYRLGDFYEMFFEDAVSASDTLGLTLTGRDCGADEKAPMCGVPYHSAEGYIAKLIELGYKVAVCEQVSDPKESKGIVKRDVVRIITPGTITESDMLDETKNNFVCSIYKDDKSAAVAFCDITEGKIYTTDVNSSDLSQMVINEIGKFFPREIIMHSNASADEQIMWYLKNRIDCAIEAFQDFRYDLSECEALLYESFPDEKLSNDYIKLAVGSLINYIKEMQISNLQNITSLDYYTKDQFMDLDVNAVRNLELVETMKDKSKKGSLLGLLDKTKTPMGARLLRRFIEKPLTNPILITKRLDSVDELIANQMVLDDITLILKLIRDIERLIGKVVYKNANPKDLKLLQQSIEQIPMLKYQLEILNSPVLNEINEKILLLLEIFDIISSSIADEPPTFVRDGSVIKDGYNDQVDELRNLATGGKDKLLEIEARERENTGIKNLKIGYNKVFGYYIEVTKMNAQLVPDYYIRKQTLANQERYIIEELKVYEDTVLTAEDKLLKLEQELYLEILDKLSIYVADVQSTASAIAYIDVLASFANVSITNNYTKPIVNLEDKIIIKDGRHPVVEKILKDALFVPNDSYLNTTSDRISVITGPNMAGKSTYMRQVALTVIMAQIGSFVPCKSAEIGVVDKVFTRVGASDDLATGQSTFMVEMNEVSYIIKNATDRSLIILDEIGRGTSTFDGMSIAKSVVEHILNKKKIGAKTLFSTHYHELSSMESENDGIKNYNIAVKKNADGIVFLRKIIPGGTDDSYGIEVAKLAGIPNAVIDRAYDILKELETGNYKIIEKKQPLQLMMSEPTLNDEVISALNKVDINTITPIEALNLVYKLKSMI